MTSTVRLVLSLLALLVALAAAAGEPRPGYLGLNFTYHPPSEGSAGYMTVRNVAPGGPAERAGVQPGDLIVEMEDAPFAFSSAYEMLLRWASQEAGTPVKLTIMRKRKRQTIELVTDPLSDAGYERWKATLAMAREEHERMTRGQ